MQRNTFSSEKQWISGPLDKRCTTLVELGTDGTVQNPKNAVPLHSQTRARMLMLGHSSMLDGTRLTASLHPKSATMASCHVYLAIGSPLIRPKADYVCSQEHSKVSFQLLGIFPVTRKAPHTATLGIFLRSRDAVAWNLRLTDD